MKPTSEELKIIFLDKFHKIESTYLHNRHMRKTMDRLWDKFDEVWVRYNNNKATYQEWEDALDLWIKAEHI